MSKLVIYGLTFLLVGCNFGSEQADIEVRVGRYYSTSVLRANDYLIIQNDSTYIHIIDVENYFYADTNKWSYSQNSRKLWLEHFSEIEFNEDYLVFDTLVGGVKGFTYINGHLSSALESKDYYHESIYRR